MVENGWGPAARAEQVTGERRAGESPGKGGEGIGCRVRLGG